MNRGYCISYNLCYNYIVKLTFIKTKNMENKYQDFFNSIQDLLRNYDLKGFLNDFLKDYLINTFNKILERKDKILTENSDIKFIIEDGVISAKLAHKEKSMVINVNTKTLYENLQRLDKKIIEEVTQSVKNVYQEKYLNTFKKNFIEGILSCITTEYDDDNYRDKIINDLTFKALNELLDGVAAGDTSKSFVPVDNWVTVPYERLGNVISYALADGTKRNYESSANALNNNYFEQQNLEYIKSKLTAEIQTINRSFLNYYYDGCKKFIRETLTIQNAQITTNNIIKICKESTHKFLELSPVLAFEAVRGIQENPQFTSLILGSVIELYSGQISYDNRNSTTAVTNYYQR